MLESDTVIVRVAEQIASVLDLFGGHRRWPAESGAAGTSGVEALANAAKHANVTVVDVSTEQREQFLTLAVRDDGLGGADPNGPGRGGACRPAWWRIGV